MTLIKTTDLKKNSHQYGNASDFLFVETQGEVSNDSQLIKLRDTISNSLILGVFIDVVDQLLVQSRLFGLNGPPPLYLPLNLTQEMTQLDHWKMSMEDKQTEQKGSSCNVLKTGFYRNAKELLRVGLHWRVPFIENLLETVQVVW